MGGEGEHAPTPPLSRSPIRPILATLNTKCHKAHTGTLLFKIVGPPLIGWPLTITMNLIINSCERKQCPLTAL